MDIVLSEGRQSPLWHGEWCEGEHCAPDTRRSWLHMEGWREGSSNGF